MLSRRDCADAPEGASILVSDRDRGYAVLDRDTLKIVIDGSSNLREWLENLLWIPWGKSGAALGFRNVASEMYTQIQPLLADDPQIEIVGHSRGGAVGISLGLMLSNRLYDVCRVVTFGCPKVGGRKFKKACEKAGLYHIRVIVDRDIVPKLPFVRGKHYEKERHVLKGGRMKRTKAHLSYGVLLRREIHDRRHSSADVKL